MLKINKKKKSEKKRRKENCDVVFAVRFSRAKDPTIRLTGMQRQTQKTKKTE